MECPIGGPRCSEGYAKGNPALNCKATPAQITALFDRWNESLATHNPDKVAANYAPDAVLPTLSNRPRTDSVFNSTGIGFVLQCQFKRPGFFSSLLEGIRYQSVSRDSASTLSAGWAPHRASSVWTLSASSSRPVQRSLRISPMSSFACCRADTGFCRSRDLSMGVRCSFFMGCSQQAACVSLHATAICRKTNLNVYISNDLAQHAQETGPRPRARPKKLCAIAVPREHVEVRAY